ANGSRVNGIVAVRVGAQTVAEGTLPGKQFVRGASHAADQLRVHLVVLAAHLREREATALLGHHRVERIDAAVQYRIARRAFAPANARQVLQRFLLPPGDVRDDIAHGPLSGDAGRTELRRREAGVGRLEVLPCRRETLQHLISRHWNSLSENGWNPPGILPRLSRMTPDNIARYSAFASRDPRFDGVFFVGVTSTGIYCRPVCTARTPKAANCRFFDSAEAAERASFRPCLRCRPELAPGNAPVDDAHRIAHLVAQRIDEGMLDDGAGLERIAARFGWSSRQIRRLVHHELGVSPMELVLTRRLLLAKQLLTDTTLSVTDVAFASGFSSVRRFNDAFVRRYAMPPSRLRHAASGTTCGVATRVAHDSVMLRLTYRAPFDWEELLGFLRPRALRGVEWIDETAYHRAVQLGAHSGWVCVTHAPEKRALVVEFARALTPALPPLLGRLRHLFDLDARP